MPVKNPLAKQEGILQATDRFSNPYENYFANHVNTPRFDASQFDKYYKAGNVNTFIAIQNGIEDMDQETYDALTKDFALDLEQGDYRMAVLSNRLFADNTEVKDWTDKSIDQYGQEVTTTFTGTEMAHNEHLYRQYAEQLRKEKNMELKALQKEEWRKAHGWLAFGADVLSVGANLLHIVGSAVDWVWNVASILPAAGGAIYDSIANGEDLSNAYVENSAYLYENRPYGSFREEVIAPWEMQYTFAADVYGNYNKFSQMLEGLSTSFGRMIPSMLMTAAGMPGELSHVSFYVGMTQEEIGRMANDPVFAETPGWEIITNSALRMAAEYAIERVLDAAIGASIGDRAAFGYYDAAVDSAKQITAKSALKRLLKDAVHEGLEEWYQDFSGYMINGMFGFFSEEFNVNNKFDLETQADALVLGFLGSLGTSGFMMAFDRITTGYKGGIKGYLADWEFRQVYSDMAKQIEELKKRAKNGDVAYSKVAKTVNSLLYTTQTIADYMDQIGALRSQHAIDLLNNIAEWQSKKGFLSEPKWASNTERITEEATKALAEIGIYHQLHFEELKANKAEYKAERKANSKGFKERLSELFRKRNVTEIKEVVSKEETVVDGDSKGERNILNKLLNDVLEETGAKAGIITVDGDGTEMIDGVVVTPEKELKSKPAKVIAMEVAQRDVVSRILGSDRFKRALPKFEKFYRISQKMAGNAELTSSQREGMVLMLMFNSDFQKICLAEGSKEVYEFISVLDEFLSEETIQRVHGENSTYDDKMKQQVKKSIVGLKTIVKEFIINQQYAQFEHLTILSDPEKRAIYNARYGKGLANRVVFTGKITDAELENLRKRVNSTPLMSSEKAEILDGLKSKNLITRYAAMQKLDNFYRNQYFSSYNGKTYLLPVTTANQYMNVYLEKKGLTAEYLARYLTNIDQRIFVATTYGKYISDAYTMDGKLNIKEAILNDIKLFSNGALNVEAKNGTLRVTLNSVLGDYGMLSENNVARVRTDRYTEVLANEMKSTIDSIVFDNSVLYDINEVVFDSSVKLNDAIMSRIERDYGGRNDWNTRLYAIRDYLTDTSTKTVVFLQNGTLAIADLVDSYEMLTTKNIKTSDIKSGDKLTKWIKGKYLQGLGKDVVIKVQGKEAYFDGNNTVYLPGNVTDRVMRANLVHETQHVIQQIQAMNGGLSGDWATSAATFSSNRASIKGIFEDIRKLNPELVKGVKYDLQSMAQAIQDIVYFGSGEAAAYGLAGRYQHFIPFLVDATREGITVTTPLGNTYVFTSRKGASSRIIKDGTNDTRGLIKDILESERFSEFYSLINKDYKEGIQGFAYDPTRDYELKNPIINDDLDELANRVIVDYQLTPLLRKNPLLNSKYKSVVRQYLSSEMISDFQKLFAAYIGVDPIDFEKLKTVKIPFVRFTNSFENNLSMDLNSVVPYPDLRTRYFIDGVLFSARRSNYGYLMVGEFTLEDLLVFYPERSGIEALLSSEAFNKNNIEVYYTEIYDRKEKFEYVGQLKNVGKITYSPGKIIYSSVSDDVIKTRNDKNFIKRLSHYEIRNGEILYFDTKFTTRSYEKSAEKILSITSYASAGEFGENINEQNVYNKENMRTVRKYYAKKLYEIIMPFAIKEGHAEDGKRTIRRLIDWIKDGYETGDFYIFESQLFDLNNELLEYSISEPSLEKFKMSRETGELLDISSAIKEDLRNDLLILETGIIFPNDGSLFDFPENYYQEAIYNKTTKATIRINDNKLIIRTSKVITNKQLEIAKKVAQLLDIPTFQLRHGNEVLEFEVTDSLEEDVKNALVFNPNKMSSKKLSEENVRVIDTEKEKAEKLAKQKKEYAERRRLGYVSNADARGTNLEFYIKKGRPIFMDPRMQNMIKAIDPIQVDETLWDMIGGKEAGTLTSMFDLLHWVMDNFDTMNDYTLQLISKYIYKTDIHSKEELDALSELAPEIYALQSVLWTGDSSLAVSLDLSPEGIRLYAQKLAQNEEFGKKFRKALDYYNKYKGQELQMPTFDVKMAMLQHYDGSLISAMYAINIAKWQEVHHFGDTSTVGETMAKDRHGETYVIEKEDEGALQSFQDMIDNLSVNEMEDAVYNYYMNSLARKWAKEGISPTKILTRLGQLREKIEDMDQETLTKMYYKVQGKQIKGEVGTQTEINDAKEEPPVYGKRTNTRTRIKNNATRISKILRGVDTKRFLSENGDIFDENLKLKQETYVDKSQDDLDKLLERILNIREKVKAGAYMTKAAMAKWDSVMASNERLKKKVAKIQGIPETGLNKRSTKAYSFKGVTIVVDSETDMPFVIQKIMETNLSQTYKTDITGLTEGDEHHARMSRREFIAYNSETLGAMTEDDIRETIDFMENSSPRWSGPDDEMTRRYEAFSIYTLSYMVGLMDGTLEVPTDLKERAETLLKKIVAGAGTKLAAWAEVVRAMRSEEAESEVFRENSRKLGGIIVNESQAIELIKAVRAHDLDAMNVAMDKIRANMTAQYKKGKRNIFDKMIKLQRAAMLSSPGTMIRNQVSNVLVMAGNNAASVIGKMFTANSKKFSRFEEGTFVQGVLTDQYVLTGTKVTKEVKDFIQRQFIDSGLLALIQDGMNRYDTRKMTGKGKDSIVADLIIEKIKSEVFAANQFNTDTKIGKTMNSLVNLVMKGLSDGTWVNRKAISYFGKMLTEEEQRTGTNMHTMATNRTYEMLADAYVLASFDYMHKPNFWNKIEDTMRYKMGPAAYFVYKQMFPFAAASWNWAVEGLKYSPIGLAKAIVNTFKLEKIAGDLEVRRQNGDIVPSSKFTEFLVKRDIGKGFVGSMLWGLGAALAAFGLIRLDDEDDKLKLVVWNDTYIDVTSIFGSSSLLAGAALVGQKYIEDYTFWDAFKLSLSTVFNDWMFTDMYNSFRYDDSIADWLISQPSDALSKFVPNIIKNIATIANVRKIKYSSDSFVNSLERLVVSSIPGIAYAFPAKVNPYTGETMVKYKLSPLMDILGLSGIKIRQYDVSIAEQEALANGVQRGELSGKYQDLAELGVTLTKRDIETLNKIYGTLNKKELELLINNKKKYKVKTEDGKTKEMYYRNMTSEQKKDAITQVMSDNASIAKIYIATRKGLKYYTTSEERLELLKLGIKSLYIQTDKKKGFVQ